MKDSSVQMSRRFGSRETVPPRYTGFSSSSRYLVMRDGVKIAVDIYLPKGLKNDETVPAILQQTRYWRNCAFRAPFRWFLAPERLIPEERNSLRYLTERGYAIVLADVRGTGASFGRHDRPWSREAVEDGREIVDWIIRQPWSNGRVGSFGSSYAGTAAEYLAVLGHPAVRIVIPRFNHPDAYRDICFPGGLFNKRFIQDWGDLDETLDRNDRNIFWMKTALQRLITKGVKPVDLDPKGTQLSQAIQEHEGNVSVYSNARNVTFRDDKSENGEFTMDDLALHSYGEAYLSTPTRIVGWASWLDAGTADAALRRFLNHPNATIAVIGAWDHGGFHHASPYMPPNKPPDPSMAEQFCELEALLAQDLRDSDSRSAGSNRNSPERILHYYTMGEESWKTSRTWPPVGTVMESWFLSTGNRLAHPASGSADGYDEYPADFEATTGASNRWWEMGVFNHESVHYPDRREDTACCLAFRSEPLSQDMEISGYPVLHIWVSSTHSDGAFFAYLEDEDEDGRVRYITEGQLRALHRKIPSSPSPYKLQEPYHSFRREDVQPLEPGKPAELAFGLHPTSVLIRTGHRIRVSFAAHDADTFERIPCEGLPVLRFYRGPSFPSRLEVPVVHSSGAAARREETE